MFNGLGGNSVVIGVLFLLKIWIVFMKDVFDG